MVYHIREPEPTEGLQERLRKFLEDDPLYRRLEIPGGISGYDKWPERVTIWCPIDKGPNPFRRQSGDYTGWPLVLTGFKLLEFTCGECDQFGAHYFVLGSDEGEDDDAVGYVQKIGQYPPFDISVPKNMHSFLGESEPLYKNGLINLSVGFGIGALAYMRRIVEDKVRDILLLLADIQEAEGAAAGDVKETRDLAEGRQVDPILKRAAELLPGSLRPGGENPLDRIYDSASSGIHAGTEDEAVSKAMAIKVALEYVVPRLQQQIEGKQAYLDAMGKLDEGS